MEYPNTIQATDDIASMMDAFKSSKPKSKATETQSLQKKALKSKAPQEKAHTSKSPTKPQTPKTKSFKKSSASPGQFPSATPNIEECSRIPQSCQH